MANRRTQEEIERDYNLAKAYFEKHQEVISIKEIAEAIGITKSQLETSLSKHPRVYARIKRLIDKNQEDLKVQKEQKEEVKKEIRLEEHATEQQENKNKLGFSGFVIDASIVGTEDIKQHIEQICATESKVILTSVTIKELEKMQKFDDKEARDARQILAMAAEKPQHFECVLIDESAETPDDCIVKFCAEYKEEVYLLTSDKTMVLKARSHGVIVEYFKQEMCISTKTSKKQLCENQIMTLYMTRMYEGELYININNKNKKIRIISQGIEYNQGFHKLKRGDDVYVATKKDEFITFAHYRVISLREENNCELVSSKRIYDRKDISSLEKADYKTFVRDFTRFLNYSYLNRQHS